MADVQEQPCWYILHTYSGYEMMVKDSLFRLVENNNLQDQIFDVKIPMEQTIEEKNGKRKVVERKLLPCYVFIKMIYSNQLWYLVTNTRGVTGFVGPQGRPIPMKDEEIRKMRLEEVVEAFAQCIVDEEAVAFDVAQEDVAHLGGRVARAVKAAHYRPHARAYNRGDRNLLAFKHLEYAYVRQPLHASAAEHEHDALSVREAPAHEMVARLGAAGGVARREGRGGREHGYERRAYKRCDF